MLGLKNWACILHLKHISSQTLQVLWCYTHTSRGKRRQAWAGGGPDSLLPLSMLPLQPTPFILFQGTAQSDTHAWKTGSLSSSCLELCCCPEHLLISFHLFKFHPPSKSTLKFPPPPTASHEHANSSVSPKAFPSSPFSQLPVQTSYHLMWLLAFIRHSMISC